VSLEGEIVVTLDWDGQRVRDVAVRSTRPLVAPRVLTGKTATDAAATVPLLYSICGGAQGAAAACALAAAGAAGFERASASRDTGIVVESLQEGFWHLLIGWPNALGSDPQVTPVTAARYLIATSTRKSDGADLLGDADAMRSLAARLTDIATRAVFGVAPAVWLDLQDVAALAAWAAQGTTAPARMLAHMLSTTDLHRDGAVELMPAPNRDALVQVVAPAMRDDPAFVRMPTWAGQPVESSALARMRAHPLVAALDALYGHAAVTRIVARMAEIGVLLAVLGGARPVAPAFSRTQSVTLGHGDGLGAVETARGLLLHRARVHDECVVEYQIVAPTEWNFHPDGALVRGLVGTAVTDPADLLRKARLDVHSLDPCVACRVEIGHA
jgi:uptake hydrogenase large subunit